MTFITVHKSIVSSSLVVRTGPDSGTNGQHLGGARRKQHLYDLTRAYFMSVSARVSDYKKSYMHTDLAIQDAYDV